MTHLPFTTVSSGAGTTEAMPFLAATPRQVVDSAARAAASHLTEGPS